MTRLRLQQILFLVAMCLGVPFALDGCNIVAPVGYLVEGPPSVDAEYKLADVPTLVFVDDRQSVVSPVSLRKVIADKASGDLMAKKLVTTMLSSQDAMALARQRERSNHMISIEEIGEAVGAKQVIYVEMSQFTDTPDGFTPRPMAFCRVKVLDLQTKKRMYPPEDSDKPSRELQVMTREVDPALYSTRGGRLKVFEALAEQTGTEIGKLFYKHEIKELGGSLNPR